MLVVRRGVEGVSWVYVYLHPDGLPQIRKLQSETHGPDAVHLVMPWGRSVTGMDHSIHPVRRVERPGPIDDALVPAATAPSELGEGLPEETFADPDVAPIRP